MANFAHDSIEMHYEIHEGLVDRDTLCIHGNLAANVWWEPAIDEWKKRRAGAPKKGRLILAEWRGCGGTKGLERAEQLKLPLLAADYNALLRSLNVRSAAVIGHSTGGLIALYAMQAAPELYSRALLLDPVGAQGIQFGPEMEAAFAEMSRNRDFCATIILSTIYGATIPDTLREKIVDAAYSVSPVLWKNILNALCGIDFRDRLPAIKQPVLVLHGEHDAVLPIADSKALTLALPNAKFEQLAGRGHCTNVEDPALFVNLAESFLFG